MHPTSDGYAKTPDFVTDGGYWENTDNHTYIGSVPDDVEYYVPDTVTTYTLAELQERQRGIHAKRPMKKGEEMLPNITSDDMTDAEVNQVIADWVAARE